MDRENFHDWNRNLILIHSKMKCTFLLSSGKTCIKDRNGTFHCISVIHPVQPYRECHFLLNEECSPDTIEYVSKAQLWWRTYSPTKTCLLCCIRNVLTAIPDCYRYTDFCNRTSHMLPVVFRIQSVGIVSIVFSTKCVSISFAQTTLVLLRNLHYMIM